MFGGRLQWQEPDDVAAARRRCRADAGRARDQRRPRSGPHPGLGHVPAPGCPGRPDRARRRAEPDACSPVTCSSPVRSGGPTCRAARYQQMLDVAARQGAAARRRHPRASRPRRRHHHRSGAGHQPVPAGGCSRRGPLGDRREPGGCDRGQDRPAVGLPGVPAGAADRRASRCSTRCAAIFELHGFASLETRAVETARAAAAQGRDRQGGVRPAPAARRGRRGARQRRPARAALRPDGAVRALRAAERRSARLPVPPLPDPEGVARRATAGGALPRVHPGRHRHRRTRRPSRSTTRSRSLW